MKYLAVKFLALALSGQVAHAATIDTCNGLASLNIEAVDPADAAHVAKAIEGKRCALPGTHSGVWVFEGQRDALQVGVMPFGQDKSPHLVVQAPKYTVTPVKLSISSIGGKTSTPAQTNFNTEEKTIIDYLRKLVSK